MLSSEVKDPDFTAQEFLYDDGFFVVAWGIYERIDEMLAARWHDPSSAGFPTVSGKAVWFVISERLSVPFLQSLLGTSHADQAAVLRVLEKLRLTGKLLKSTHFDITKAILPNDS